MATFTLVTRTAGEVTFSCRDSLSYVRIFGADSPARRSFQALERVAPGEVEIRLPFRDDLTQQHGYLHAGVVTTPRPVADPIRQLDFAFENAPDINRYIAAMLQTTANINPGRISQPHSGHQQILGQIQLMLTLQLCQLNLAIHPQHFPFAIRLCRAHRQAFGNRQAHNIGQIVFALSIVIFKAGQPVSQTSRRHHHDPGIDFANFLFFSRSVFLLDDALHIACSIAHDTAIAARIGQIDGQNRDALARSLQLRVIAEGVETEAELRFVARHPTMTWWRAARPRDGA